MPLYTKGAAAPAELPYQDRDADGRIWTDLANSPEGLAACGYEVAPEPPAYDADTQMLEWNGGWVVTPLPFGVLRTNAQLAAGSEYDRRMAAGFPHDFGSADAPDPQTLQVASIQNQGDWLVLDSAARDAIAAGGGDQQAQPPFRCSSNAMRAVSWTQCKSILDDARTWGGAMRTNYWRIKDAIAGAADAATLAGVDVTAGYPA